MPKVQVLIIGGDADRNIHKKVRELIDFDLIPSGKPVLKHKFDGKQIVILLTRWVSSTQSKEARKIATQLGMPLAHAVTGNHIPSVLEKHKLISKHSAVEQTEPEQPKAPAQETVTTDPDAMTTDDLWKIYGSTAISFIESLMAPGEKQDEATLLGLLTDPGGLAISRTSCKRILDELHSRWRLINTVGTTWKLLGSEEEYSEDLEPVVVTVPKPAAVPKPEKERKLRKRGSKLDIVALMAGLPAGPYQPKARLYDETIKYDEFLKLDGSEPSRSYIDILRKAAIENGIIEDKDGALTVKHDPAITLTPRAGYKAVVKQRKKLGRRPKEKPVVAATVPETPQINYDEKYISLQEFQHKKPAAPAVVDVPARNVSLLRAAYGGEIPWYGEHTATVRKLRSLVPIDCWNEMAARTVAKKLFPKESRSYRDFLAVCPLLEAKELDFLAWETIKDMPLHVLAPWLRDKPEDMKLSCKVCDKAFVFSVGEQLYLERQFGQVIPTRSCQSCRTARRLV